MSPLIQITTRIEFLRLAFKFSAFRQKFFLRAINYQSLIPDFDLKMKLPRLSSNWEHRSTHELQPLNFAPFGIKLGDSVGHLFKVLGKPIYMDCKSYRSVKCTELQYRTKVGKLKCRISFLVSNFKIQLMLLQIMSDQPQEQEEESPLELLLGHQINSRSKMNQWYKVGPDLLHIEQNLFRSQFLLTNPKLKSISGFKRFYSRSQKETKSFERLLWYRKTFGTIGEKEF